MHNGREVRVELEARPGAWHIGRHYAPLHGWMYNGDVPGPVIEARIGDTLVVRLTNGLPESTSLRLSGLRVSASTRPYIAVHRSVSPRATCEYRFALSEPGTFWYHPVADVMQIERGLHGVLVVRGTDEPPADAERILVFDDVCLGRRSGIASRRGVDSHDCAGDVLLLNGRVQPRLLVAAAHVERWRLVNVAHARSVRFSLGGAPFRIVAGDADVTVTPTVATEIMLAPGARADLLVGPLPEGTLLHVQSLPDDRGPRRHKLAHVFGTVIIGAGGAEGDTARPLLSRCST